MTLSDDNEAKDHAVTSGTATSGAATSGAADETKSATPVTASADGDVASVGTALTDVVVDPFAGKAVPAPEPAASRSIKSVLFDYSAHAAMIVGLIGFAWTVSDHVVTRQTAAQIEAPGPVASAAPRDTASIAPAKADDERAGSKRDEVAELRTANERMARDVDSLRAQLGTLQAALGRAPTSDQVRALSGDIEGVKAGLNTAKGETGTAIAALSGRLDKMQRETDAKVQRLATNALEHQGIDTTATGSIAPGETLADAGSAQGKSAQGKSAQAGANQAAESRGPVPVAKPATRLASADKAGNEEVAKPAVLPGWVVREVYRGVALIEGRRGSLEVVPGVSIPGAGVVKSIDRHGNGWTVTTTKGMLAYAAPQRDPRRNPRDDYPDPRYDY